MAVLHLRRRHEAEDERPLEIQAPLPLRRPAPPLAPPSREVISEPSLPAAPDPTHPDLAHEEATSSRGGAFRRLLTGFAALGALSVYPGLVIAGSGVGDEAIESPVDRSRWSAPWAGAAAALLEAHYDRHGWAGDAGPGEPMSWLTAKPAYQTALAQSVGEYLSLMSRLSAPGGVETDADLVAATRLVGADSTAVRLRAAVDALENFDRRLIREGVPAGMEPAEVEASLGLIDSWAARSKDELANTANPDGGLPFDRAATVSVYSAKARALAAFAFLDSLPVPSDPGQIEVRTKALEAWRNAAEFHPLLVLNMSPDASVLANHAASMSFLVDRAQDATQAYAGLMGVRMS